MENIMFISLQLDFYLMYYENEELWDFLYSFIVEAL